MTGIFEGKTALVTGAAGGAWELTTRWSTLDLDDGLIQGGKMDIISAGLTWWLNPIFGVNFNYRYIWN